MNRTPPAQAGQGMPSLGDRNALLVGATRQGKSSCCEILARTIIASDEGVTIIDPHGSLARGIRDWLANPVNGQQHRTVHYLEAGGRYCLGLNVLHAYDQSWEAFHEAASTLASIIESRFEASAEQTPRLARLIYVAAVACSRHKLTLVELVELLSLGGHELRRAVLEDFNNRIVARELEDLKLLAQKHPREFLNLVESCRNRLLRWMGNPQLVRIFGQSPGLDPLAVMDRGDIVLCDLSAFTYADAALVGTVITSMYLAASRRRPPLTGKHHRVLCDEAESFITLDTARALDQTAKRRLNFYLLIQRLGQVRAKDPFISDAVFAGCGIKICFGGLEPQSALYMAETQYSGHVDMQEYKPASVRPVAVGNDKVTLRGSMRARHHVEQSGSGTVEMRSAARMRAFTDASMQAWGAIFSTGTVSSFQGTPDTSLLTPPTLLSEGGARSDGRGHTTSGGRSHAATAAEQSAHGRATQRTHGVADGESQAEGEHEAFVTRYKPLPTQMYSLPEQWARLAGKIMSLPRRECIVRVENDAPFHTRTQTLSPAFRSETFRQLLLPHYLETLPRRSCYLRPVEEVDAEIEARIADFIARFPKAEPPMPDLSEPEAAPQRQHPRLRTVSPTPSNTQRGRR